MKNKTQTETQTKKPDHRTMSFRKARLMRQRKKMIDDVTVFTDALFNETDPRISRGEEE